MLEQVLRKTAVEADEPSTRVMEATEEDVSSEISSGAKRRRTTGSSRRSPPLITPPTTARPRSSRRFGSPQPSTVSNVSIDRNPTPVEVREVTPMAGAASTPTEQEPPAKRARRTSVRTETGVQEAERHREQEVPPQENFETGVSRVASGENDRHESRLSLTKAPQFGCRTAELYKVIVERRLQRMEGAVYWRGARGLFGAWVARPNRRRCVRSTRCVYHILRSRLLIEFG